jgi:hypothetical protein
MTILKSGFNDANGEKHIKMYNPKVRLIYRQINSFLSYYDGMFCGDRRGRKKKIYYHK